MRKKIILVIGYWVLGIGLAGCMVRTYPVIKERVDQDLTEGNRGYLVGKPKISEKQPRKTTREIRVVEVELYPIKFGQKSKPSVAKSKDHSSVYVSRVTEQAQPVISSATGISAVRPVKSKVVVMKKYTIQKNDTLQKISKKFYGTTTRWKEIYEINREILKTPHSIYPGQVIEVPVEEISGAK